MNNTPKKFETRLLHVGQEPEAVTGAIIPPIFATSTYVQKSPGKYLKNYDYGRSGNPTRDAFEECMASLEGGEKAFAFSSGLAGTATLLEALPHGSHIIASDDLYGGTFRLFDKVRSASSNLSVTYLDLSDTSKLESAIKPNTKMLWVETPTNPLLKLYDLEALAAFGKAHNLITVCDNTFASPYLQRPLEWGFDCSVHSTTKYINGHSDVIGGVVVIGKNPELRDKVAFLQNAIGSVPSPFDTFLTLRGVKTLAIRMDRHCDNAEKIAQLLATHPSVEKVYYPGLASHPSNHLVKKQMTRPGAMISFVIKGGLSAAKTFLETVSVFSLAESLGGVESLIEHPALMTHATIPVETRNALGITNGFIRLSVGVEHVDDLIADLEQAFSKV